MRELCLSSSWSNILDYSKEGHGDGDIQLLGVVPFSTSGNKLLPYLIGFIFQSPAACPYLSVVKSVRAPIGF